MPTGSIERRNGKWFLRVYLGRGLDKKQRYHRSTHPTKQEAQDKRVEVLASLQQGAYVARSKETLAHYLQNWLDGHQASRRTVEGYETWLNRHVVPRLGAVRLTDISPAHLRTLYKELRVHGLAARSIRHIHVILSGALRDAVREGKLARNVAQLVDAPRAQHYEAKVLTTEETWEAIAHLPERWRSLFTVLAFTGMRRNEAIALRWRAVDLERAELTVRGSVTQLKDLTMLDTPTKTGKVRTVNLLPQVATVLRTQRERVPHGADDLVFPREDGTYLRPHTVSQVWRRAMQDLGHVGVRLHDLRHGFATFMHDNGVSIKEAGEALGHSSIAVTADIYTHLWNERKKETAERLGQAAGDALAMLERRDQVPADDAGLAPEHG